MEILGYKQKTVEEQDKDLKELSFWERLDKETYFHKLELLNKFKGVDTYEQVEDVCRVCSNARQRDLYNIKDTSAVFDESLYKAIHKYLFQDFYYFAGDYRTMDMEIDPSTVFTGARFIPRATSKLFGELKADNYFVGLNKEQFIDKIVNFHTEMIKIHPFRQGNGRTTRTFETLLAKNAGYELDFGAVSKRQWLLADECAFDSRRDYGVADTSYLKYLYDRIITPINKSEAKSEPNINKIDKASQNASNGSYSSAFLEMMNGMAPSTKQSTEMQNGADNKNINEN